MNHNETETSIALSYTTGSVFTCPHVPELTWDVHDTITPWIFAVVSFTISPTAVLLNALVIIAMMKRRGLRTLSNILLASMAVTDLLVGGICVPLSAIDGLLLGGICVPLSAIDGLLLPYQILAGQHICTLDVATAFVTFTMSYVSLVHLVIIAWERYVAIRRWRDYRSILTKGRLKKLAVIAWISSILCILTPNLISMVLRGETTFIALGFSTASFLALIVYFYVMVFLKIRKQKINELFQASVLVSMKMERRVAITTAMVTAAVILSFVPVASLNPLGNVFPVLLKMSSWRVGETLMLSNSLVNPLIYCYRDRHFRKAVLEILRIKKISPKNAREIRRWHEERDEHGSNEAKVQTTQEADTSTHFRRSASFDSITFFGRAHIEANKSNRTSLKRNMSAPLILIDGSSWK